MKKSLFVLTIAFPLALVFGTELSQAQTNPPDPGPGKCVVIICRDGRQVPCDQGSSCEPAENPQPALNPSAVRAGIKAHPFRFAALTAAVTGVTVGVLEYDPDRPKKAFEDAPIGAAIAGFVSFNVAKFLVQPFAAPQAPSPLMGSHVQRRGFSIGARISIR